MRPLSVYEATIVSRTEHAIYFNYVVGAEYTTITLNKDLILKALSILCNKYPQFSMHIDNTTKGELPICSYLPSWDLSTVDIVDIHEDGSIDALIAHYNNPRLFHFKDMKPLWRVALLKPANTLLFLMDHTFFDGTAAKNFHYHFADALHDANNVQSLVVDTTQFDEYPDPTVLLGFDPKTQPSTADSSITAVPPLEESLMNTPLPVHNSTFYHISADDASKLIEVARSNGTKLTALLYAIVAKSVIGIPSTNVYNTTFKAMIPINTRPKVLQVNPNTNIDLIQFGQFFGKYFHLDDPAKIANDSLKDISTYFQSKLDDNLSHAMDDFEVFEFKARKTPSIIDESLQQLHDRNATPRTSLAMSNLGVLKSKDIGKLYFDQPMMDACFGFHLVSSSEAGISINFTSHRAVNKQDYAMYVTNVKNQINMIL